MPRIPAVFCAVLLLAALHGRAGADPYIIYTTNIPPYQLGLDNGRGRGLTTEIIIQAMERAGLPFRLEPPMPWARALALASITPFAVVCPFGRTALRERDWQWAALVLDDSIVALTRAGTPAPKSLADLGSFPSVGVHLGSASESLIAEIGLSAKLEKVDDGEQNLRKLLNGRIAVWVLQRYQAAWTLKRNSAAAGTIAPPTELTPLGIWVAMSTSTPKMAVEKLGAALRQFRKTPDYAAILAAYAIP